MTAAPGAPGRPAPMPWYLVAVPALGVLAFIRPLAAAALVVLAIVVVVVVASPAAFVAAAALLSTAIPKAGFVLNGFPVPVMMFALLLAAPVLRSRIPRAIARRRGARMGVVALAWLAFRLLSLRADGGGLGDMLALAGWYGLPIVLLLAGPPLGALRGEDASRWTSRLETGLLVACAFSLVQQLWGIERTALPGVTRAVGADYSAKPLQFAGGSKIPSTYQNGNILGVVTGFFFLVAAERVIAGDGRPRDRLVMAATAVASVLSGSRTVLAGLALGLVVLLVRSRLNRRTLAVCATSAVVLLGVLQLSPALSARLTGTSASDPALGIRAFVWDKVLHSMSLTETLVGGSVWAQRRLDPGLAEGVLGAIQQVGVVGIALFLGVFWAATNPPELRRWRLVLIPVAVSFAVDSAYLVFPTIFVPLVRMFAPIRPEPSSVSGDDEEAAVGHPAPPFA